jgi:hypothetical protein
LVAIADLPARAFLQGYARAGAYADCFVTELPRAVTQAAFVEAFYTTWLFKLERLVLRWVVARPSTDAQARELAKGARESFAAWDVERRDHEQLLMCDLAARTRSWLMTEASESGTRLYFGSAVVPSLGADGKPRMGAVFRLLLGFHQLYSRLLLRAAARRLTP